MERFRYDRLTYLEIRERAQAGWLTIATFEPLRCAYLPLLQMIKKTT